MVAVGVIAAVALTGCSTSNPTGSTNDDWGSVAGTVSSDRGLPVANIEIHLWAEIEPGRTIAQYDVVTDAEGAYEIEEIDLSYASGSSEDYEIYANRTKGSALPVNEHYGTYAATVTVEKGEVVTLDIEIVESGPGDPEQYFD
jgi:hypothetical protein